MRISTTIPASAVLFFALSLVLDAKDWRGLTPLHSTRRDVEKLLGPPPPPPSDGSWQYTLNDNRSIYRIDEGDVYIVYARQELREVSICPKGVPNDTVLVIEVTLKKRIPLREFPIDVHRSQEFDPSQPKNIGFKAYLDKRHGIMVRSFKGNVDEVWYFATADDRHRCPEYYANLKSFASLLIDYF